MQFASEFEENFEKNVLFLKIYFINEYGRT